MKLVSYTVDKTVIRPVRDQAMELARLGYTVDEKSSRLIDVSGGPFRFTDQHTYDEVAAAVTVLVQELMVAKYAMQRLDVPYENAPELRRPVFLSNKAAASKALLILVCGAGKLEAGLWSRKRCLNDSLRTGTVLPFLEWAHERNIGVLVLNPNVTKTREGKAIPLNETRTDHIVYAWDNICRKLPVKQIAIVGHSCGGVVASELLKHRESEVLQRLKCIAFSDSGHRLKGLPVATQRFILKESMEWKSSNEPLGKLLRSRPSDELWEAEQQKSQQAAATSAPQVNDSVRKQKKKWMCLSSIFSKRHKQQQKQQDAVKRVLEPEVHYNCTEVSAGTPDHEHTTMSAFPHICEFILSKLQL